MGRSERARRASNIFVDNSAPCQTRLNAVVGAFDSLATRKGGSIVDCSKRQDMGHRIYSRIRMFSQDERD